MGKYIYADNAATTKPCRAAIAAMTEILTGDYGNPSSIHSPGRNAAGALYDARAKIAGLLGCRTSEVYFTSGGSEADNQAIISAAEAGERIGKKHIISTAFEHHAVLRTLDRLKARGFSVTLLDVHENGIVTADEVAAAIRPDTCLVSVMYANNEIGSIQPIAEIGKVCRNAGVIFHTDAVQAAGHLRINTVEQNIDMMSLSAHKFHGPCGIGVLYARTGIPLAGMISGGAQERGKRAGTENLPAIAGMAAALVEACEDIDRKAARVSAMRDRLIDGLSKIPGSALNGDRYNRLPGNVSFCFEGIEGETVVLLLDRDGIAVSSGSACTSGSLEPSHVLLAIGRSEEAAKSSLRISVCGLNTDEDIDRILEAVPRAIAYLRTSK